MDIWEELTHNEVFRTRCESIGRECEWPARATLLEAGTVAQHLYLVRRGCVRLWFNRDGKDITLQFFCEGQGVASLESFIEGTPSVFSIETIEPTTVLACNKADILRLVDETEGLKDELYRLLVSRLIAYTHLFLSRIRDTPQERYANLLREHPEIVRRVPQHYIASYLGITSVSLSRIRSRK